MSIVVAAGILLFDSANKKYLLARASGGGERWGIPKGKQEANEHLAFTARREFKEETGFDFTDRRFSYNPEVDKVPFFHYVVETNDGKKGKKYDKHVYIFYGTGDNVMYYPFACESYLDNGKPEIDAFGWYTLDECLDKAMKSQKGVFEYLKQYREANEQDSTDRLKENKS
jgi:8-oxo-dGTP pyrophosphatase MutT (NUDIX family)